MILKQCVLDELKYRIHPTKLAKYLNRDLTKLEFKSLFKQCRGLKYLYFDEYLEFAIIYQDDPLSYRLQDRRFLLEEFKSMMAIQRVHYTEVYNKQEREVNAAVRDYLKRIEDIREARDNEITSLRYNFSRSCIDQGRNFRPVRELSESLDRIRRNYKDIIREKMAEMKEVKKIIRQKYHEDLLKARNTCLNEWTEYLWLFYEQELTNQRLKNYTKNNEP